MCKIIFFSILVSKVYGLDLDITISKGLNFFTALIKVLKGDIMIRAECLIAMLSVDKAKEVLYETYRDGTCRKKTSTVINLQKQY